MAVASHHPYTGASAFAHKGGLHASAMARFPHAYEHTDPNSVGNHQRVLISELAGRASLISKAKSLGFDLEPYRGKTADMLVYTLGGDSPACAVMLLCGGKVIGGHLTDGEYGSENLPLLLYGTTG